MTKVRPKVFVGMSGGVDSSVSAALLAQKGYEVIGVFIKAWEPSGFKCTWREDRRDAMRVAAKLRIPFVTLDLEHAYKEKVVDYMINEYKVGRTPNPDVMCNKEIKFGLFYDYAIAHGADYVATGHYAQILKANGMPMLAIGADQNKDQSYFLWNLKSEQLEHIFFPLGGYEKSAVRKLAEKFKLSTAAKKDSQGLCFMGKLDVKEFLKQYLPLKPGDVVNEQGEKIGTHEGIHFYTIGERHGLNINASSSTEKPHYVIAKNLDSNTLTVSKKPTKAAEKNEFELINHNWIPQAKPRPDHTYLARARYRQPLQECQILTAGEKLKVIFNKAQSVALGQSIVFYDGNYCLGGGVIS